MEKPRQIPFDLLSRTAYAREDFRVSSCNSEAMAWIDRWPAWPAPLLTLNGAPGSGKTHLARIWQEKSKACIPEDSEQMEDVRPDPPAFLLDDIERFIGSPERENRLFHLYNRMKEKGGAYLDHGAQSARGVEDIPAGPQVPPGGGARRRHPCRPTTRS